ncbi:MAG: S26 family signal peptidase [Clostridia bacterium]|nr:S26 family signal peptidase [Clostridia bacterium]
MEDKELMNTESVSEETAAKAPSSVADEEEKPLSKKKKIVNGILLGVQIVLVLFAIILTLIMILNPKQDEVSGVGIKLLPVLTDSMDGERTLMIDGEEVTFKGFAAGALVIAKNPDYDNLKVGDIVIFQDRIGDEMGLNTHRIIEVVEIEPGLVKYRTQGDNPEAPVDSTLKLPGDIKAVYVTHINGLGNALFWIRDGYHFIYVIIIPLGLLLIYNIYLVAMIVVEGKMKKAKAAAAEDAKAAALASIDEEEIKRKAIEEYLRQQAAANASTEPKDGEDK